MSRISPNTGTAFNCSNVSGSSVNLRFLILSDSGSVLGDETRSLAHGATIVAGTQDLDALLVDVILLSDHVFGGVVNIEANNSAVFCNAIMLDPDLVNVEGAQLPLVRVNAHPGTVE